MKILTTLVALLVAGASAFGNVSDGYPVNPEKKFVIFQPDHEKFQFIYADTSKGDVRLSILNEKGAKLYSQRIANEEGFARQFDFALLPDGKYIFEVVSPEGVKITETVMHKKSTVSKPSSKLLANVLNIDGKNKFSLTVLNSNNEPVSIKIYDDRGRLLHKEKVTQLNRFRKTYDLKNHAVSSLQFVVSTAEEELTMVTQ